MSRKSKQKKNGNFCLDFGVCCLVFQFYVLISGFSKKYYLIDFRDLNFFVWFSNLP
jgi:hypothetical protein